MERDLNIPIPETDKQIYGLFREVAGAPIVVFVHGFTSHRNEHHYYNGARAVEAAGFSSYRFDLYGRWPHSRTFFEATVGTHAEDVDTVVRTFKTEDPARKVTVIGHSLGALSILASKERHFDNIVLWDPSHPRRGDFANRAPWAEWCEPLGCWRVNENVDILTGVGLVDSWRDAKPEEAIVTIGKPVKIIAAGAEVLLEYCKRYYELAQQPKELAIVDGAYHNFNEGETAQELYAETITWLDRHGR